MPRVEDVAWKFVNRLDGKRWRCPYCKNMYSGSVTRVKSHFLKQPKEGISSCPKLPEHIRKLMGWLLNNQVHNKEDIAWKFVNRLGEDKWRCHYCGEEFFGDLIGVKDHLLKVPDEEISICTEVPNQEISICTEVPEHVRKLMLSLLDEVAEERSREANGQFSAKPKSHDMSTQAEVAEKESREANSQSPNGPQSHDMLHPAVFSSPQSFEYRKHLYSTLRGANDMANLPSDQQQGQRQFHQSLTMPSPEPNSHGESISCSTTALVEGVSFCLHSSYQLQRSNRSPYPEEMQMNDQQTLAGASSIQYNQLSAVGNSHCLQYCNQHSQLQTPMDVDRSIASQHTSDSHISEATIVDSQVSEAATDTIGPSSSQASVPLQCQIVPRQSINLKTAHQNPTMPSSSWKNHLVACLPPPDLTNTNPFIPSSSQVPNNAPPPPQIQPCGTSPVDPSSSPELEMNEGAPMTSYPNTSNNFEENRTSKRKLEQLYRREAGMTDELKFGKSLSLNRRRMEDAKCLPTMEMVNNDLPHIEAACEDCLPPHQQVDILTREAEDFRREGKGLFDAKEIKFRKFLEGKMVGEAFKRITRKILENLVVNQVSRLGIYGMGGVGKTTIMKIIYNRLLEQANYGNVFWITVSQDFNAQKLQNDIWEALGLGTLQEKDVNKRAAMLSDCLTERGKFTIILDDVWECLDLEEVGIPVRASGFKLVLTTRSFDVCCQMQCQEKIKIEPLSQEEAESLFLEELGHQVLLDLEIKAIVKSIVKECAGLPIGVITMARSMRGATDAFQWRDFLVKLKESSMGQTDMEKKVLMNLKFSYDRLGNPNVQQCFLSCALYPEDELIDEFELIEFFIDQGLIDELNTRKEQYDRGLTILKTLTNVCLLEDHEGKMKMHDLIRDMALHIMSATSIVKARKGLIRIPPEEYWTGALQKVSLMKNHFIEFPLNVSPNCPKLSTLLLNGCLSRNVAILDSFLKNLLGLKVLNLSGYNMIELPNSISELVNLRALLLRECRELRRISYVGKLTSLRKLDARDCGNLEVLKGLEKLVNLRYLDLTKTRIERLPKGTLECLLNLQCLEVSAVIEEDITKLGALETFECCFENADDFNKCVRAIEQSDNPRYYDIYMDIEKSEFIVKVSNYARFGHPKRSVDIWKLGHAIVSVGGECTSILILIPRDVQKLRGMKCNSITNLSSMGPLECLEELEIEEWEDLGVLYGGHNGVTDIYGSPAPAPTHLQRLRVLIIKGCLKLKYLFGHGSKSIVPHLRYIEISKCKEMVGIIAGVTSPPPHPLPFFPRLEEISVDFCDEMKKVVESEWMPHFPNLRSIKVSNCENMEEILRGPPPHLLVGGNSLESLIVRGCNKMRKLLSHEWLVHLRNLRSIKVDCCKGMVEMISRAGQGEEGSITTRVNNTPSSIQPSISLPKLEWLELLLLPQLKSICEVPISCDIMKSLRVYKCPELKGIPLQLQLREMDCLPHIWVEDEEKWRTVMCDHPDAQAILKPFLRKGEHANEESYFSGKRSPNAIG